MLKLLPIELNNVHLNELKDPEHQLLADKIISSYEAPLRLKPWLGYFAQNEGQIVGCCGFKSNPSSAHRVEIAYQTFKPFEKQGYATDMCNAMLKIATSEIKPIELYALTLPDNLASERVLLKSKFKKTITRIDHDGKTVNEWIYRK